MNPLPKITSRSLRAVVEHELRTNTDSRQDSRLFIYNVLAHYGFDYPRERFMRLPRVDYITRVRRSIELELPSLRDIHTRKRVHVRVPQEPEAVGAGVNTKKRGVLSRIGKFLGVA